MPANGDPPTVAILSFTYTDVYGEERKLQILLETLALLPDIPMHVSFMHEATLADSMPLQEDHSRPTIAASIEKLAP